MGLGSTTKKIQTIADKAEEVYAQVDELRKQLADLRTKVDATHDTVTELKVKHEQNRALLEAIAEEQGVDVDQVLTEAAIDDVDEREHERERQSVDVAAAAESGGASEPANAAADPETDRTPGSESN